MPCVRFFLDKLDSHVQGREEDDLRTVIQTAAVLSTIANFVAGRQAPRFVAQTLRLGSIMLTSDEDLVQQWGALLVAEILGSIAVDDAENQSIIVQLREQLLVMIESSSVETRATSVYALSRWVRDVVDLDATLALTHHLVCRARHDASPIVRKELMRLFRHVLRHGGPWTTIALWAHLTEGVAEQLPEEKETCLETIFRAGQKIGCTEEDYTRMCRLGEMIGMIAVMRHDPDKRVADLARKSLIILSADLERCAESAVWSEIYGAAFTSTPDGIRWNSGLVTALKAACVSFLDDWDQRIARRGEIEREDLNNELFETSKLSLQAHLAVSRHVRSTELR